MPRKLTCADCGSTIYSSRGSLPQGEATCRPCRSANRQRRRQVGRCPDCGGERSMGAEFCRSCRAKRQVIRHPDDPRLRRAQRETTTWGIRPSDRDRLRAKWVRQGRSCYYCDQSADTIDHVVPLARGGTNYEGNLVPCCKRCNSAKQSRTVMEWRLGRKPGRTLVMPRIKPARIKPARIVAINGEQPAFNVCPECGSLCVNRYCNATCNSRYVMRRNYRAKVGIPLDHPNRTPGVHGLRVA